MLHGETGIRLCIRRSEQDRSKSSRRRLEKPSSRRRAKQRRHMPTQRPRLLPPRRFSQRQRRGRAARNGGNLSEPAKVQRRSSFQIARTIEGRSEPPLSSGPGAHLTRISPAGPAGDQANATTPARRFPAILRPRHRHAARKCLTACDDTRHFFKPLRLPTICCEPAIRRLRTLRADPPAPRRASPPQPAPTPTRRARGTTEPHFKSSRGNVAFTGMYRTGRPRPRAAGLNTPPASWCDVSGICAVGGTIPVRRPSGSLLPRKSRIDHGSRCVVEC